MTLGTNLLLQWWGQNQGDYSAYDIAIEVTPNAELGMTYGFNCSQTSGFRVNWGDGTATEHAKTASTCSHTYAEPGVYVVTIRDGSIYTTFNFGRWNAANGKLVSRILRCRLPNLISYFTMFGQLANCTYINPVDVVGNDNVTDASAALCRSGAMTDLPNLQTAGVTNIKQFFANNGTTFMPYLFPNAENCETAFSATNITTLPSGFSLPHATAANGCFQMCYNLTALPDGFEIGSSCANIGAFVRYDAALQYIPNSFVIPSGASNMFVMFQGSGIARLPNFPQAFTETTIDIRSAFSNCAAMTGTAPAALLWEDTSKTWSSSSCFNGCTSLSNYADIPSGWK